MVERTNGCDLYLPLINEYVRSLNLALNLKIFFHNQVGDIAEGL